jgi:hypothetical protein
MHSVTTLKARGRHLLLRNHHSDCESTQHDSPFGIQSTSSDPVGDPAWYGARFSTQIHTRGWHWFPRLLASSEHACDQWNSPRMCTASYRHHRKLCRKQGHAVVTASNVSEHGTNYCATSAIFPFARGMMGVFVCCHIMPLG